MNTEEREELERDYDRPSLHSPLWSDRVIGRLTAIIDQHIQTEHREADELQLFNFHCSTCGFDVRAKLNRLYPAGGEYKSRL